MLWRDEWTLSRGSSSGGVDTQKRSEGQNGVVEGGRQECRQDR